MSYLAEPKDGRAASLRRRLEDIGGYFVVKASNATGRSYLSVAGEGVAGWTIARLLSRMPYD